MLRLVDLVLAISIEVPDIHYMNLKTVQRAIALRDRKHV